VSNGVLPDKKGYGFDGCSPKILLARAEVKDGLIVFPGGSSYRLMVLPQIETMTPGLLAKIRDLVQVGRDRRPATRAISESLGLSRLR
jgi:hypothetical protein